MSNLRDKVGAKHFAAYVAEVGLDEPLTEICRAHHVALLETYLDVKGPTVHAARLECWWWMMHAIGKSAGEVARIFDREAGSIHHAMRLLRDEATTSDVALAGDTIRPIARLVAARSGLNQSKNGRRAIAAAKAKSRAIAPTTSPQERVSPLGASVDTSLPSDASWGILKRRGGDGCG